ncbi:MAG: glycoside hydrolase family 3 C-terminal domain-containing protein, partial [Clostridia bacterium]|nr:glycoside hydrolase family 3 C-terminal domain-containing protein [Clostridia bacterium]
PQKPGASVSYLAGIREALAGTSCAVLDHAGPVPADDGALEAYIREAAEKAEQADAAVVVLGGSSSRFRDMVFEDNGAVRNAGDSGLTRNLTDCGEGVDVSDITLPLWQRRLLSAVREAIPEKPLIVILNAGRPYASESYAPLADGLLCAFYAGPAAGSAVAEILFGDVNPSGRLSVSIPRTTGEIPAAYNRRASYDIRYADASGRPDYPFGFGLSYTEFALTDIRVTVGEESVAPGDPRNPTSLPENVREEGIALTVRVENRGQTAGDAVPMLFVRRRSGSVIPRFAELKDFTRLTLEPGASADVTLHLTPETLAVLGADMKRRIEPGAVDLMLREGEGIRWRGTVAIR